MEYLISMNIAFSTFGNTRYEDGKIIELSAVLMDFNSGSILSKFNRKVRQHIHLSNTCTELTGINARDLTGGKRFPDVLQEFHLWLNKRSLVLHKRAKGYGNCFLAAWDSLIFTEHLPRSCRAANITNPVYFSCYMDLCETFEKLYPKGYTVKEAVKLVCNEFRGSEFNTLDVAFNLAKLAFELSNQTSLCIVKQHE